MIAYEVTAEVEPRLAAAYERYMREKHIPEVFATGCFHAVSFERAASGRYRIRYQGASQEDLDRYLREHTARLRADFLAHFPTGATLSREVWTELQRW
jgi:Domain of unknown function (DUF4286)